MKILVLVQSTELKLYAPLLKAQEETWNSVPHPEVDVVYYQYVQLKIICFYAKEVL